MRCAIEGDCPELIEDLWPNPDNSSSTAKRTLYRHYFLASKAGSTLEVFMALLSWPAVNVNLIAGDRWSPLAAASKRGVPK